MTQFGYTLVLILSAAFLFRMQASDLSQLRLHDGSVIFGLLSWILYVVAVFIVLDKFNILF